MGTAKLKKFARFAWRSLAEQAETVDGRRSRKTRERGGDLETRQGLPPAEAVP